MGKLSPELKPFHRGPRALSLLSWFIAGLLVFGTAIRPAQAAIYTVTKTTDTSDGACDTDCSLREAISVVNAGAGSDTVVIPPGSYPLTLAGVEDLNAGGDFDLLKDVTITGAGAGSTTINGGRLDRVFHIPGTSTVAINGLTISGGLAAANTSGGGLHNNGGSVTISNSTISDNWANSPGVGSGQGGGIYNGSGTLMLINSTVDNNQANGLVSNGYGGGICNNGGVVTVSKSTISGNSANYAGGGIMNFATLILTDSTMQNNSANGGGGALYNQGVTAAVTVTNSTLFGNTATFWGGGLQNFSGNLTMINATISANSAPTGGGINRVGGTVTLTNTILAANQNSAGAAANCAGTVVSNGHNLESANSCLFSGTGDLINTDPQLRGLADNGGKTPTMPLLATSPAVDAGTCLQPSDQRGMTRPQGVGCDIGAYEYYPLTIIPSPADFRTVPVGATALQVFTLFNHSPGPFTLSDIALAGDPAYTLDLNAGDTPCGSTTPTITTIGANANYCTVGLTFAPLSAGLKAGTLTVSSNDTDPPTTIVALSGVGIDTGTTAPGAPTIGTATPGPNQATVTFTPPPASAGSPILGYTVTANPGGQSASGPNSPITVSGLTNATAYTFTVTASNAVGQGPPSAASNSVIPQAGVPAGHLLDTNTVALWRLNETTTAANAVDETGIYPLTQYGSPDVIAGQFGNGRLLNGTSKFFQRTGDANLGTVFNGDWTYEGWVSLDPAGSGGMNLLVYNGLAFSFNQPDTILAEVGISPERRVYWHQWQTTSSFTERVSTATLLPGYYYHLAVSRTAQGNNLYTYRIYVNGVLDTTTTDVAGLASPVPGASHFLGLGNYTTIGGLGTGGNIFNGRLDDTRLSKIARTDAEIFASFAASSPVPGAPTIGTATAGPGRATVRFTPPASDGGSPITGYTVTASPGGRTATGTASPLVITGLTNGTTYSFTVTATNAAGTGPASAASNSVTPRAKPGPPLMGTALAGDGAATITFSPPIKDGGSPILGYTVTANPGGLFARGTGSPLTVTGLTNGTPYTFTVTADNAVGTGPASGVSNQVICVPEAPTVLATTPGANALQVAIDTPITATFSKDLNAGSINPVTFTVSDEVGAISGTVAYDPATRRGSFTPSGAYLLGSQLGSGAIPVTSANGALLNGLTIGQWYAVETGNGPFYPFPGSAAEYGVQVNNGSGWRTVGGSLWLASREVVNTNYLRFYFQATTTEIRVRVRDTAWSDNSGSLSWTLLQAEHPPVPLSPATTYTARLTTGVTDLTGNVMAADYAWSFTTGAPPATVPGAPAIGTATAGNAQATVTFSPPTGDGGSPITGYTVTANPGGRTASGSASPLTVTGLTNGTAYTFTVTATNAVGQGPASAASNRVTPVLSAIIPRLVALYPMNGDGQDAGGNGYHATVTNAVPDRDRKGKTGQALHFDGNATLLTPALPTLNSFSIAGWVKWDRLDGWNPILDNLSTCTRFEVYMGQITLSSCVSEHRTASQPFAVGTWYHLAATYDGGSRAIRYYVNGALLETLSAPEGLTLSGPVYLGDGPFGGHEYLRGSLDALRVYDGALNPGAVAALAAGTTVPGAPTIGTATPGRGRATVTFTAPTVDGGRPITGYQVTANPGGKSASGTASPLTVTGLSNGTAYTFTVTAINAVGTSPASAPSNSATPTTIPGAPTAVFATAGQGQASVSFTAPAANGGTPITGYRVISNPAGGIDLDAGSTSTSHTVTSLTNDTTYTFTARATNAVGTGPASAPSNSVTPSPNPTPTLARTTWLLGSETNPAARAAAVVVFLDESHYLFASDAWSSIDPNCFPINAMEQGTYTWDPLTGSFAATATYKSSQYFNCGLQELQATVTVNGNTLLIDPPGPVSMNAFKVAPLATNPMAGAWSLFDPGQPQNAMALVVFNDAHYLLIDHSAPSGLPTECGNAGLEHGTYLWDQNTGALTATAVIDTNGCWGLGPALPAGTTLSVISNTLTVTVPGEEGYSFPRLE